MCSEGTCPTFRCATKQVSSSSNKWCAAGFHLGCMLEWQERGKTDCPVCDLTIVGPDDI